MTPAEHRMLKALVAHGPDRASGLGEWLYCKGTKHTTRKPQHYCRPAARVLRRLLARGFVKRVDGVVWRITPAGRKALIPADCDSSGNGVLDDG